MIETLLSRFQRWRPQPDEGALPHVWTHEDSSWHASSLDLARGLDVTEVAIAGFSDRPHTPPVFLDTLPAVREARR